MVIPKGISKGDSGEGQTTKVAVSVLWPQ